MESEAEGERDEESAEREEGRSEGEDRTIFLPDLPAQQSQSSRGKWSRDNHHSRAMRECCFLPPFAYIT